MTYKLSADEVKLLKTVEHELAIYISERLVNVSQLDLRNGIAMLLCRLFNNDKYKLDKIVDKMLIIVEAENKGELEV